MNSDKGTVGLSGEQNVVREGDNLRNRPNFETIQSFAWNGHTVHTYVVGVNGSVSGSAAGAP